MASHTFTATPSTIEFGESSTLNWTTQGANDVYINWGGVPKQGELEVTPIVTTTYLMHVVRDGESGDDLTVTVVVEGEVPAPDTITREPTVVLTPENVEMLKAYPRPPHDNGRGLHFHLNLTDQSIARNIERLKYIDATWTLIYAPDELQTKRSAKACWEAGIMPVVRIAKQIDKFFDPVPFVKAMQEVGVPPYVQIYNEPADSREWDGNRPDNYRQVFGERWARHAATVFDAGGYPGLQVMGKSELDAAIDAVAAINRTDIWTRSVFVVHNYGVNHPPAYPYDDISQAEHPGLTIVEDPVSIMMGTAFAQWMQDRLGFVLPIVGGEGGWQFGVHDDRRYPRVVQPYHALYHRETFEWFRTGVLSNSEPLPDYYFSITPWLVGGWNTAEDWWSGPLGDKTETIEAIRAIPPFERRFSWDDSETPPAQPPVQPPVEPPITPPVEPPVEPPITPPDPNGDLQWDPRLDALGVSVTPTDAPIGWRLTSARFLDVDEAGGKQNVYIKAVLPGDVPLPGIRFLIDWIGRRPDENPGYATTNSQGECEYPIFIGMDAAQQNGIVFTASADQPGDRVDGMGLPDHAQVSFALEYEYR